MKKCSTCGLVLNCDRFYKHKHTRDGLNSECKDCTKRRSAKWARSNKEKRRQICKKYDENNRETRLKNRKEAYKRRSKDGKNRLTDSMRSQLYLSLKGKVGSLRNVDWTVNQLINHLELQFSKGMTWDNYGKKWHVDHITPVSAFDYSSLDDESFKQCWCLSNLRPLWAADNIRKSATIEFLI